MLWYHNI